jgi:oxygen-independent coproporphyrinogen III oxidase
MHCMTTPSAAYVHIPFCKHHCGYCDFAVTAGRDDLQNAYLDALTLEMKSLPDRPALETLFLGGGTPTHLTHDALGRLMEILHAAFEIRAGTEFSMEATPESLDEPKVALLRNAGVNRISLGVQSFLPGHLQTLERVHAVADIAPAVGRCLAVFPQVSIDLIFAVPGQSLADWSADLQAAVALGVGHIATYGLTYEKGTPLWKQRERKQIIALGEDHELAMYQHAMAVLPAHGFRHYELSNFAKPGHECRHNRNYWANGSYFGFGVGAARYCDGIRELNTRSLHEYIRRLNAGENPTFQREELNGRERAQETIFTNLRRAEGISRAEFFLQTGYDFDALTAPRFQRLLQQGMLQDADGWVYLTDAGKCVADAVMAELMAG